MGCVVSHDRVHPSGSQFTWWPTNLQNEVASSSGSLPSLAISECEPAPRPSIVHGFNKQLTPAQQIQRLVAARGAVVDVHTTGDNDMCIVYGADPQLCMAQGLDDPVEIE